MKREPEEEARVADENEDEAAERMAPPPHDVNAEELRLIFFFSIAYVLTAEFDICSYSRNVC